MRSCFCANVKQPGNPFDSEQELVDERAQKNPWTITLDASNSICRPPSFASSGWSR